MTLGTVAYSAPEQLLGEPIDGRADQYALAASTFHMLTGRKLFDDTNLAAAINKQVNTAPPRLADVRPELAVLDPVLTRALSKNPGSRFANCTEFATVLAATPGSTATDVTLPALVPAIPRRPSRVLRVSVPAVLALGLVGAVVFAMTAANKVVPPKYVSTSSEWQPYVDTAARMAKQMFSFERGNEAAAVQALVAGSTGPLHEMLTEGDNADRLIDVFRDTNATSAATVESAGLESFDGSTATVPVAVSVRVNDQPEKSYRLRVFVVREDGVLKASDLKYPDGGN